MITKLKKVPVFKVNEVVPFTPEGGKQKYCSRLLIDANSVGSKNIVLNHFTLQPGQQTYSGSHPDPFEEVYYILRGKGVVTLSEDGKPRQYEVGPGSVAYIAPTVAHQIKNIGDEDLEMLTMMPFQPTPGVNTVYDERKKKWGTSFRLVSNK